MATASPDARLWRNRDFNIFWAGRTLSALGDAFALIALPLLVWSNTGSVAQMGLVTSASGVSLLITGFFAGVIVDRVDRRLFMIICDIARALLYASIPLVWWFIGPQLWLLFVVAILGAALSICFQIAYTAAIANLVDYDQITDANGRLQTTVALAAVAGPMLAGVVSGRFGPATAIGIDACTFLISAFSLSLIRLRKMAPTQNTTTSIERPSNRFEEMSAGFRFVLHEPVLRAVALIFFLFTLVASGGYDLFIYHLKTNLEQGDYAVGTVFGVASLGAILGGLLAPRLRRRWGFGACFLGSMVVEGLAILLIGFAPTVPLIALAAMVMVFANTVKLINSFSLRQQMTPDHLLGRVTAAFWLVIRAPRPLGAAAVTALGAQIGAPTVIVLIGAAGFCIALFGLFTPARIRHPEQTNP
ncbi:MAG: MFS transporter [Chloroflexi bacterium AL-W]|nr:MFS transporter [Chloroflexi bacterium AL-N1]NOK69666.1 MFS transporter [Chloroflexi bacterium AL-N10]NOK72213.1 MFS transporter [Chloroflexi bacterium AL-N5]NOK85042.1 MFS transporter [Chloroflexi bacterium AL-W]NOK91795.1 MFS transporter [Chloroflexi bacterium AL-N15]